MIALPPLPRPAAMALGLTLGLTLGPTGPVLAQEAGDPAGGLRLARAWCANCHAVDDKGPAASTGAPAFVAIAADKTVTAAGLRVFFQTPHQRMPDLHLSNDEIDNLSAYILSLKRR